MTSKLVTNSGGGGEIVSLLTNEGTSLPVELVPDTSAATIAPLSSVLYVDGASTAVGTPNGSQANPFLTIQAAADASVDQGTIYICWKPTAYDEVVNCGTKALQFQGILIPNEAGPVGAIRVTEFDSPNASLALQNLEVTTINAPLQEVDLIDVDITSGETAGITCANLIASARHNAGIAAVITSSGGVQLHNVSLNAECDCAEFEASADWTVDRNPALLASAVNCTGSVSIKGMALLSTITGQTVHIDGCEIDAGITITATSSDSTHPAMVVTNTRLGDPTFTVHFVASVESNIIEIDTFTKQWLVNADLTTWGAVRIIGAVAQEQIAVVVPAVTAGDVGYVNVTPTGELANCIVGDVVVANPTADLVAAGAGGGYINCRVSAPGTIRLAFVGPLAGGSSPFNFCRLSRAPFP